MTRNLFKRLLAAVKLALDAWHNDLMPNPRDPDLTKDDAWEEHQAKMRGPGHAPARPEFIRFLDDYVQFEHPDPVERAVAVAVLLVIGPALWGDPAGVLEVINRICRLLARRAARDPKCYRRAPEFVMAYLVGWCNPWFNVNSRGLDGCPDGVRFLVLNYLADSVDFCFPWLERNVIGFSPGPDRWYWAVKIFNRLIARKGRRTNWERAAELYARAIDPDTYPPAELQNNARRKANKEIHQHRIRAWLPWKPLNPNESSRGVWTLWLFLQRAVKGAMGEFDPTRFPSGMLWEVWNTEVLRLGLPPLKLVNIAVRACPNSGCKFSGRKSYKPACEFCGAALDGVRAEIVRGHITLDDEVLTGFSRQKAWTCRKCGHVYPAQRCGDACPESGPHDRCRLCKTAQPMPVAGKRGARPRPRTVYFYNPAAPTVDEPAVQPPRASPPDMRVPAGAPAPRVSDVLQSAFEEAKQTFAATGWVVKLIVHIEESVDDETYKWLWLLGNDRSPSQSRGSSRWHELDHELKKCPDRPASVGALREVFCESIQRALIGIFQRHIEAAGFDWEEFQQSISQATRDENEGEE
jgi:hypothetical protein